jgi:hypothetical protein
MALKRRLGDFTNRCTRFRVMSFSTWIFGYWQQVHPSLARIKIRVNPAGVRLALPDISLRRQQRPCSEMGYLQVDNQRCT